MSAPNNNIGQGSSQPSSSSSPPHVVQTILESFTRCFAPINECSSPSSNHTMDFGGNCYSSGITGAASATAVSSNDSMNSKQSRNITTKVPRTRSSSIATATKNEGGRRSRKSSSGSSSRPIPTPEEINERSLKRKLEIFRGSGGQSSSRVVQPEARNTSATAASTTTTSSSNNLVVRQQEDNNNNSRGQSPHSHQTSTSDDDDDEEEILRLTQNSRRHRFGPPFGGCGLGYLPDSHDNNNDEDHNNYSRRSPLFTNLGRRMGFGSGGRWSPPTGFLCFATPVRSNSGGEGDGDIVAHLSDDNLTADEFLSRHGGGGGGNNSAHATAPPPPPPKQVSPEHATTTSQSQSPNNDGRCSAMSNQGGGSVYTEITDAQTIESALYFDQKYSHVIQTRPPMPLFQENMVTSYGDSYCRGTSSTGTTSSGGGGGGGSSFLLFGKGLLSNSNVGNEISTIITKKRTK